MVLLHSLVTGRDGKSLSDRIISIHMHILGAYRLISIAPYE